ncbi:receptor-like protein 19 [Salvia miltiorrhiza]|uniref:receptor-like protein 19 n=1 Tax=Salvia miltiorrhiza TaxID=226208 RepID=UPI0025AC5B83|nr:receptor-like protein 19 [Salvia miltiorrhiza]
MASFFGMAPFDGKSDFSIWKQKMKCILIQQHVFKAVDHSYADNETEEKKSDMNELALSSIILNLSDCVLRKVGVCDSAKDLWCKLEELYTEKSLPSKLFLLERFFQFELDLSKDVDENLDVFSKLVQDIKLTGDEHIDDYAPIVLLNAIPESYSDVKSAIKYGRDNVTFDTVVNALKSKELDLKHNVGRESEMKVMHVRERNQFRPQKHASNQDNDDTKKKKKKSYKTRTKKCYNCGKPGHFAKDCPSSSSSCSSSSDGESESDGDLQNEHANLASCSDNMGNLFSVVGACDNNLLKSMHSDCLCESEWRVDSGCSFHMSPFKNLFSNFQTVSNGCVSMANGAKCHVVGIGDVRLKFESGYVFTLKHVRYVPDLCFNLLSCSALESDGLEGRWGKGQMEIVRGSLIVFTAEKCDNMYVCLADPVTVVSNCVDDTQVEKDLDWRLIFVIVQLCVESVLRDLRGVWTRDLGNDESHCPSRLCTTIGPKVEILELERRRDAADPREVTAAVTLLLLLLLSPSKARRARWLRANDDECCKWPGVECDAAGYVISLQLDNDSIAGEIADSSSLFKLMHLQKLNLAFNYINYTLIPRGIHNLTYLTHLNLSNAGFGGQVPAEISSLRRKWSHIISSYLPNLTTLSLRSCGLSGPLAKSFGQLHSLSILRLDENDLSTELPDLFANFPSLTTLTLANCGLKGSIPSTFANLTNLIRVDLSGNSFTGSLSSTLFEGLSNLVYLDLSSNSFLGNIPHSLFALPSLLELYLSYNQFSGTFQLDNFPSLSNLTRLGLSYNRLSVYVGNVNSTSYGSLQLKVLGLASCNLSHFPNFIKYLDMELVDLSDNRIAGEIPSWIWGTQLQYLNLSFNLLTHLQKPYHIPASLRVLYLDSNQLKGELHLPIPPESQLWYLSVANNSLSGSIPTSLCSATNLDVLDLSGNRLSGSIPPCLLEQYIGAINLGRNNISGSIPDNFPMDCSLYYLDVNNNTLEGKIPKSLERCVELYFMNVGNNNITDSFPCMLSSSRGWLQLLVLRSNKFHGEVRCHNMSWPYLQILDISSNHFSGNLESINFSSWSSMSESGRSELWSSIITLTIKGVIRQIDKIWADSGTIDLSCNNFGGEIPTAIGDFGLLHLLNLSHNALNGSIPNSFGQLRNLESLDLSGNRLTGPIPVELAGLSFLSVLNLSYNKLVGMIPNSRQFQTFSADSFKGNAGLCGFNLNISCSPTDGSDHLWPQEDENGEEKSEIEWEYVSTSLGYVVGLGIIVWLLLFCQSFRGKYFGKVEEVFEDICDARIRRRRRRGHARRVALRNQVMRRQ